MDKAISKTDKNNRGKVIDTVVWFIVIAIAAATVVGNIYFQQQPLYIRGGAIAVAVAVAFMLWLQTKMGSSFRTLYHGSRIELRKVVWPTSQETLQSSLLVLAVVAVISIALWLFDSLFAWLVSLLASV